MSDFASKLQLMMQRVDIPSWTALQKSAGISERQVLRLRRGEVRQMRVEVLLKVAQTLQVGLDELVGEEFFTNSRNVGSGGSGDSGSSGDAIAQPQIPDEQQHLRYELQQETLHLIESLLVQFPIAAEKAKENPNLAAIKILPLIENPLKKLLTAWGIREIAQIGSEVEYNPQYHQMREGTATKGDMVVVRTPGYMQGDKLIYRAQVSLNRLV